MTNIALVAAFYGADSQFSSVFVALSTILAMITVPCWMTVITLYM